MVNKDLLNEIKKLYRENDEEIMEKFNRSLSFQDGMFDRWKRAERLGFGKGTSIYNSSLVFGNVEVKNDTWIGPNTLLDGSGGKITIGSNCSISAGVHIYTHDTVLWALSGGLKSKKFGSVDIGDCCYIGSQSVIRMGVTIDSRSVVAANSFVSSNVEKFSIVAGTPAKRIGRVEFNNDEVELKYD
ncbi:acyltransferase [Alphaproteobacteria bacterium]|nr:acyltransferase [Alphaproteobacteria bacterium]